MITFYQGSVIQTGLLPVGGYNFTHDVAVGLKTTQVYSESLKRKFGCALPEMVSEDESIEVESVGGRKPRTLMRRDLCEVLEARSEETLELIHHDLEEKGLLAKLGSGVVLTGGGALLHGLVEMGDFVLDVPVRRGWPEKVGGLVDVVRQPSCSTVVGVLQYGLSMEKDTQVRGGDVKVADWTKKMKNLFGI
jgi:cell division protein FtsA